MARWGNWAAILLCTALPAEGAAARDLPRLPEQPVQPAALEVPFDLQVAARGREAYTAPPEAWCPTSDAFLRWLQERKALTAPPPRPRFVTFGPGGGPAGPGPGTFVQDGVIVVEGADAILGHDNVFDLHGRTIEFKPSGSGYDISFIPLAYETDLGAALFAGERGWRAEATALTRFAFPFGGEGRTGLWVTSTISLAFEQPAAPASNQVLAGQVLRDRTPRIAPLQHGTSLYGWDAWFREEADRAVFTWKADGGDTVDVQAVLFADGRIRFTYARLGWVEHGTAAVIDGNDAWWADLAPAGSATDPEGDSAVGPPDGRAMDLLEIRAAQIAGSELLQVEIDLAVPPPNATQGVLYYILYLRDEPSDPDPFYTVWLEWEDGAWKWTSDPVEVVGATLRLHLAAGDMPLSDDDLQVVLHTWKNDGNWHWGDELVLEAAFPEPPAPVMMDFSQDLPLQADGPIFEAFTLPELRPWAVYDVLRATMEAPRFDGLAIYQNFKTDLKFYAGGYSTVGNAGADGIGVGSSAEPESPALLHLDQIGTGWNGWDEGKVELLNHEFGHHWLYFFAIEENGGPSHALNPASAHPAGWVHTPAAAPLYGADDASCMGGSTWTDNGDGTFTSAPRFANFGYTWHELYMMGLAGPADVTDWWYIAGPDPGLPDAYWPPADITVTGSRVPVAIDQVVAVEGPRVPAWGDSRTAFAVPMVLVVRPGAWTDDDVREVARTCEIWAPRFAEATAGRGSVRCALNPPEGRIDVPVTNLILSVGATVGFTGSGSDPDGDQVELRWDFGGVAPPAVGPGPHPVSFPGVGEYEIVLTAVDGTGMVDPTPDRRRVTVNCTVPGDPVRRLMVSREGEALRFRWEDLAAGAERYLLLSAPAAPGPFRSFGTAFTGDPGTLLPAPGRIRFFEVAGWNLPNCIGPY